MTNQERKEFTEGFCVDIIRHLKYMQTKLNKYVLIHKPSSPSTLTVMASEVVGIKNKQLWEKYSKNHGYFAVEITDHETGKIKFVPGDALTSNQILILSYEIYERFRK